ncbi:MAG: ATP-binding cassette domain-containing protein, partial [Bacteroidales bacterium]|nr:ATP-binding cassette domain-containing protein [Bacteroidales bacterium]
MKYEALCLKDVIKNLNEGYALKSISIRVFEGELIGIIGRNDSGILTLSSILAGETSYDSGSISIFEKSVDSNIDVIKTEICHIGSIIKLHANFTIAENLCITSPPIIKSGWITYKKMVKAAEDILDRFKLNLDPAKKISRLSSFEKRIVELLRAVLRDIRIIILENPLHNYNKKDYDVYYSILKRLANEGRSIIVIETNPMMPLDIFDRLVTIENGNIHGIFHKNMLANKTFSDLIHHDKIVSNQNTVKYNKNSNLIVEIKDLELNNNKIDYAYVKEGEVVGFIGNAYDSIMKIFDGNKNYKGSIV